MQALRRLADATDALPGNHNKGKMLLVEFAVDNVQQLKVHEQARPKKVAVWTVALSGHRLPSKLLLKAWGRPLHP